VDLNEHARAPQAIALLSDVHANLGALRAVLAETPPDAEIWVMGDTVGYGPEPSEVLAVLRKRGARIVAGNHDLAVAGRIKVDAFNDWAAEAARMHQQWLSPEERQFLGSLPLSAAADSFTLVHGSLRDPVWEYVFDPRGARACLERAATPHCCHGHTHVPAVFTVSGGRANGYRPKAGERYTLGSARALINPGSVGQPRDGDPRAAWALYEPERGGITFRRTSYDVGATQREMRSRRLPRFLADRLSHGI
jgi:diadenosine tetraphosphatase ApaH/serine/threonine PP2A family protein phosphatase